MIPSATQHGSRATLAVQRGKTDPLGQPSLLQCASGQHFKHHSSDKARSVRGAATPLAAPPINVESVLNGISISWRRAA